MAANPFPRYIANGKQIIEYTLGAVGDDSAIYSHYADARDPEAANAIAYAMNSVFLAKLGKVTK